MNSVEQIEKNLDELISFLLKPNISEEIRLLAEDTVKEYVSEKPYLVKSISKLVQWLSQYVICKAGSHSADKIKKVLLSQMNKNGYKGKTIIYILNKILYLQDKNKKKLLETMASLELLLDNRVISDQVNIEMAYVAKIIFEMRTIETSLYASLNDLRHSVEEISPSLPVTSWELKFDPFDPVSKYIVTTNLVGREEDIDRLCNFWSSDAPVFILGGSAGQGKTKLSFEFCRWVDSQGGEAVYLERYPLNNDWSKFKAEHKTLIVADYAMANPNVIPLLNYVFRSKTSIKVVLIERSVFVGELKRHVASLRSDYSLSSVLSSEEPHILDGLSEENENKLFSHITNASSPSGIRKITYGNPLLSILVGEEYLKNRERLDISSLNRNKILQRRLDYLYKYRDAIGSDRYEQLFKLLMVVCLVRKIDNNDNNGWLPTVAKNLGLPSNPIAMGKLIREVQLALLNKAIDDDTQYNSATVVFKPDLLASAFIGREFYLDGMFSGQLWDFVELLVPAKCLDVCLTLSLAFHDLGGKEKEGVAEVIKKLVSYLCETKEILKHEDVLNGLVMLVGSGAPELEVNNVKFLEFINYHLSRGDLSEKQIWCLCALSVDLLDIAYANFIVTKISNHEAFRNNYAATFIAMSLIDGKLNADVMLGIIERAFLHNPANLPCKAFTIVFNKNRKRELEESHKLVIDEESASIISSVFAIGLIILGDIDDFAHILRKVIDDIYEKGKWYQFAVTKLIILSVSVKKGIAQEEVFQKIEEMEQLVNSHRKQISITRILPAINNMVISVQGNDPIYYLIEKARNIIKMVPISKNDVVVYVDILCSAFIRLLDDDANKSKEYLDEIKALYNERKSGAIKVAYIRALGRLAASKEVCDDFDRIYEYIEKISDEEVLSDKYYIRNKDEGPLEYEIFITLLRIQISGLIKGCRKAQEKVLQMLKSNPTLEYLKFNNEWHPYWFILDNMVIHYNLSKKPSPIMKDIINELSIIKEKVKKWEFNYDLAIKNFKEKNDVVAKEYCFAALELYESQPAQNNLAVLEILVRIFMSNEEIDSARQIVLEWEEKIGVKFPVKIIPDEFPMELLL